MFKYFTIYISQPIHLAVHLFNTCVSLKMAAFVVETYTYLLTYLLHGAESLRN